MKLYALLVMLSVIATASLVFAAGHFGALVLPVCLAVGGILVAFPAALSEGIHAFRRLVPQLCWWHGLLLFGFMSGLLFRTRDAEAIQENTVDAWAGYRIGLCAIVAFVLFARLILGRTKLLSSLSRGLVAVMASYCIISAISALWSVFPSWSLYKSLELMVDVALVAAILAHIKTLDRLKVVFDWAWILQSLLIASVWIGAAMWPREAFVHGIGLLGTQIVGVYPTLSANSVGALGATIALVAFVRLRAAPYMYSLLLVASVVTVVLAQARSAIIGLLLGFVLVLFITRRVGVIILCAWVSLLILSQTTAADVFWKYFRRGENQENFNTLTGRVDWWKAGFDKYMERPLTGYGAYTARFAILEDIGQNDTATIHNAFLEVLYGAGPFALLPVIGVVIGLCLLLLRPFRDRSAIRSSLAIEAVALLPLLLARCFFSSGIIWHPDLNFVCLLTYAEFVRRSRSTRTVLSPGRGEIRIHLAHRLTPYASAHSS